MKKFLLSMVFVAAANSFAAKVDCPAVWAVKGLHATDAELGSVFNGNTVAATGTANVGGRMWDLIIPLQEQPKNKAEAIIMGNQVLAKITDSMGVQEENGKIFCGYLADSTIVMLSPLK